MLATLVPRPFHKPGWAYEEKYDGDRMLAYKEGGRVRLLSRNAKDHTIRFAKIAGAIGELRPATLLLDGEVVVVDREGVLRFQLLQQGRGEPMYVVFDCLYADGKDLRREPLAMRRHTLERVGLKGVLLPSHRLSENGLEAYKIAKHEGYEGLIANGTWRGVRNSG
jgi:bifunctional non-homologous end joining protein LigD